MKRFSSSQMDTTGPQLILVIVKRPLESWNTDFSRGTWIVEFWVSGLEVCDPALFEWWSCFLCHLLLPEDCVARTRASVIASALSLCVNTQLAVPAHSLMSCDSDIFASVFLTRRAVRRHAGLWAQHSVISFPICLKHWGVEDLC